MIFSNSAIVLVRLHPRRSHFAALCPSPPSPAHHTISVPPPGFLPSHLRVSHLNPIPPQHFSALSTSSIPSYIFRSLRSLLTWRGRLAANIADNSCSSHRPSPTPSVPSQVSAVAAAATYCPEAIMEAISLHSLGSEGSGEMGESWSPLVQMKGLASRTGWGRRRHSFHSDGGSLRSRDSRESSTESSRYHIVPGLPPRLATGAHRCRNTVVLLSHPPRACVITVVFPPHEPVYLDAV